MIMFESGQLRKVNLDGSKVKTRMVSRTKTGGHKPEDPKNQKVFLERNGSSSKTFLNALNAIKMVQKSVPEENRFNLVGFVDFKLVCTWVDYNFFIVAFIIFIYNSILGIYF